MRVPRDYKDTCLLPQTAFPMKADLFRREPAWLERWAAMDLYGQILARDVPGRFVFHDGPPYANGHMHYGHILNNALKDFVTRSRNLLGERARFIPGWDCHGLPIELNVDRALGPRREGLSPAEVRARCRDEARTWVDVQRVERQRMGVLGTWDEPYLTMNARYEGAVVRALRSFVEHGLVYRGRKPVQWCAHCRTALAEAEVEYDDAHVSPSVYVKFPLDGESAASVRTRTGSWAEKLYALIWTTTPWTLAANLAIAVHPELEYVVLVGPEKEGWLVAKVLVESVAKAMHLKEVRTSGVVRGAELLGAAAIHPWETRRAPLLPAAHVEADTGTGLVHTAPGHGRDDYALGRAHGLEAYAPVDDAGRYSSELGAASRELGLEGLSVFDANARVEALLASRGLLASRPGATLTHKFAVCWRCKSPLITRATVQWFIAMDEVMKGDNGGVTLRQRALAEIDRLAAEGARAAREGAAQGWIPAWGKDRIRAMIEGRPDWCISRQRVWGVPIPAVHCNQCSAAVLTGEVLRHVEAVFAARGADAWFDESADVLPETITCPTCGPRPREGFHRDASIIDVWFESGSSFLAVSAPEPDLGVPVDLYLEGSDQHRGWFHSSLLVGCAVTGEAPYRAVLTHGFVCDENGRPYSKSEIRTRQLARRDEVLARLQAGESARAMLDAREGKWARPKLLTEARDLLKRKAPQDDLAMKIAEGDVPYIPPEEVIGELGAEMFRAWAAFVDYEGDVPYSRGHLTQAVDAYRKVRNTFRFLLGALRDEPAPGVRDVALEPLDRWALARLDEVVARCERAYRQYQFRAAFGAVVDAMQEYSAFYLDASKDWLYNDPAGSPRRTSARATMQHIARSLAVVIAPLLPFSAEDVWDHLPAFEGKAASVHLEPWPRPASGGDAAALTEAMARLRALRDAAFASLEPLVQAWGQEKQAAKKAGREPGTGAQPFPDDVRIDHPRDAAVRVALPAGELAGLGPLRDVAGELLGFGALTLAEGAATEATARRAPGAACDRCWRRRPDVGDAGLCARCDEAVRIHQSTRETT